MWVRRFQVGCSDIIWWSYKFPLKHYAALTIANISQQRSTGGGVLVSSWCSFKHKERYNLPIFVNFEYFVGNLRFFVMYQNWQIWGMTFSLSCFIFNSLKVDRVKKKTIAHLSLPLSNGWVALSFLFVCLFVRPAMVTSPLLLAPDPQTHTFSESLW